MKLLSLEEPEAFLRFITVAEAGAVEIEIGCGNGHFLTDYAERNPGIRAVGIERKLKRCLKALSKVEKRGILNAAVVRGEAEHLLPILPTAGVTRFHLYFPDPWPKSKHRKRRFLQGRNLDELARSLQPEGTILVVTDFFDYYLQAKVLFLLHPLLELSAVEPPEEFFRSIYSQKLQGLGRRVYTVAARKRAGGESVSPPAGDAGKT